MRRPVKVQKRLLAEQLQEVKRKKNRESNEKGRGWKQRIREKVERTEEEQRVSFFHICAGSKQRFPWMD